MLCVIPIHPGDVSRARNLLSWMVELGGCRGHRALIVADAGTAYGDVFDLHELAGQSFGGVDITTNAEPTPNFERGPSSLLKAAAEWVKAHTAGPFLMCEPDSTPTKSGWLDAIAAAHQGHEGSVMGWRYQAKEGIHAGKVFMSGVAVYPQDAIDHLVFKDGEAWDVTNREWMASGHHTNLICHFYGQPKLPPTFVAARKTDDPVNWLPLNHTVEGKPFFPPEMVLFHRCKDGSLIRELRRKLFGDGLLVVWPYCSKDADLAYKNLAWIADLHGGRRDYDLLLSCDLLTPRQKKPRR